MTAACGADSRLGVAGNPSIPGSCGRASRLGIWSGRIDWNLAKVGKCGCEVVSADQSGQSGCGEVWQSIDGVGGCSDHDGWLCPFVAEISFLIFRCCSIGGSKFDGGPSGSPPNLGRECVEIVDANDKPKT